ncbi:lycopene cyclase family protein, partial [Streptococcus pseudopneumoniae]|uniref:lycopene cyclase family protein n=1 Tax=Streptococcus pseudopneumoniae TaxID=257758 RepID=UPI00110C232A
MNNYAVDKADVVIVGSGVAGALLADQLSRSDIRVVILEAGKKITLNETVSRYRNNWRRDPSTPYDPQPHALFP